MQTEPVSEPDLLATAHRMEQRLSSDRSPQVVALYALYRALVPRFEADLQGSSRDIALAKASVLMLVQAARDAASDPPCR